VLLIDLRSHGDSDAQSASCGPASVDSAALDILQLLRHLCLFPTMLVGHSFGGKVVLSMVEQFGSNLPKPVTAWVLDTVPGEVSAGVLSDGRIIDHPRDLIQELLKMPTPVPSRAFVVDALQRAGFSDGIVKWVATNLRPIAGGPNPVSGGQLSWTFDLSSIADMYESYECKSHWLLLERPPKGLRVHFVKAEQSSFRWKGGDAERIAALGHHVHLLPDSGHWVHTDNPEGLLDIMRMAFGHRDDVRQIHASYAQSASGSD
jgi:pimeloyl-ACP methyl ester carboxylesterase